MKDYFYYMFRGAFCAALLLLLIPERAVAQKAGCDFVGVTVVAHPLHNASKLDADAIVNDLATETESVLESINRGSVSDWLPPGISLEQEDRTLLETACTLHRTYRILAVPRINGDEDVTYEVRGLHLKERGQSANDMPRQLVLVFDNQRTLIDVDVTDPNNPAERYATWSAAPPPRVSEAHRDEIFAALKELEQAYNDDADSLVASIRGNPEAQRDRDMQRLRKLLSGGTVRVSKLTRVNGQDSTRISEYSADRYVNNLASLIANRGAAPMITYEYVHVYPHRDDFGENSTSLYRIIVVQHWMFPPNGYIDTDYLALQVQVNNNQASFRERFAGSGSLNITSQPEGIQIVEMNGMDWGPLDVTTPFFEQFYTPHQEHTVTLESKWYDAAYERIGAESIVNGRVVSVDMQDLHRPGLIEAAPDSENTPALENTTIQFRNENTGSWSDPVAFEVGDQLEIPVASLKGKPGPDDTIEAPDVRMVDLRFNRECYVSKEMEVTLMSPDEAQRVAVQLERERGALRVTSTPGASDVLANDLNVGQTPLESDFEVTCDDEFMKVRVKNDTHFPGSREEDYVIHIPSELRNVRIEAETPASEHFDLTPFIVRNETKTATIDVDLGREGDQVNVSYALEDLNGRNRKYVVDFAWRDTTNWQAVDPDLVVTCSDERTCVGKGVRADATAYAFMWNMQEDLPTAPNAVPVLTLRKKSSNWYLALIPAAAGVAAAYIFPRTGSNDNDFLPPPRPDDF